MVLLKKAIFLTIAFVLILAGAFALSPDDAIAIVSVKNNYLLSGETASVLKSPITYQGTLYDVVAGQKSSVTTVYIPLKDADGNIASLDLEIREVIKTAIVYTGMTDLKNNTQSANWPFSYSTRSFFYDLSNDFTSLGNDALSVQTLLNSINTTVSKDLAKKAGAIKDKTDTLSEESKTLSTQVDDGMKFETDFLASPDSAKTSQYQAKYETYFNAGSAYKQEFVDLETDLDNLNQSISSLDPTKLTVDQQKSYQLLLTKAPIALTKASRSNTGKLDSFFSTNDQIRTMIEDIFSQVSTSEKFASVLESRKSRNDAWLVMYGYNPALLNIDPSFETLEKAATAILSKDNVDLWANRDAVDALTANWNGAKSRYNNSEYAKAKDFAVNATKNVKQIIDGGVIKQENNSQDIVIQAIAGLIIALIIIFAFEKFSKKKKEKTEEYDEP